LTVRHRDYAVDENDSLLRSHHLMMQFYAGTIIACSTCSRSSHGVLGASC
jgi:hypothetical protein